jgi:two-component system response regulator HydG
MKARVLVVDDDEAMCSLVEAGLTRYSYQVTWKTGGDEAFELLSASDFDVVVTDLNMRGMNGLELCERIVANRPDIPVIVITAFGSLDTAVAAIRAGAYDFLTKPFEMRALRIALERGIQHRTLRDEVRRLQRAVTESRRVGELLGNSLAMRQVFEILDRLADQDVSVLITGETGTGKERVAKTLHRRSARRDGPFVAIDCAALPETLLESELFGHASGAFTDARSARTGLFVQANEGTLFLDEIGELPLGLQPKLLRALQERRVRPVGGNTEVPFDVRVIAATNRDLETAVEEGRFRRDLYYRINVVHMNVPPLRARGSDILLLAQYFLERIMESSPKRVTGFSPAVAERLLSYAWPGNVRELQNCVARAIALTAFSEITVEDLPALIRNYARAPILVDSDNPLELLTLEEVERRYILRVLEATAGNKTLASQILGMDRKTLYRKLERYGTPEMVRATEFD